jgi:hypothetical protein
MSINDLIRIHTYTYTIIIGEVFLLLFCEYRFLHSSSATPIGILIGSQTVTRRNKRPRMSALYLRHISQSDKNNTMHAETDVPIDQSQLQ